jgi:hypothetical protein
VAGGDELVEDVAVGFAGVDRGGESLLVGAELLSLGSVGIGGFHG